MGICILCGSVLGENGSCPEWSHGKLVNTLRSSLAEKEAEVVTLKYQVDAERSLHDERCDALKAEVERLTAIHEEVITWKSEYLGEQQKKDEALRERDLARKELLEEELQRMMAQERAEKAEKELQEAREALREYSAHCYICGGRGYTVEGHDPAEQVFCELCHTAYDIIHNTPSPAEWNGRAEAIVKEAVIDTQSGKIHQLEQELREAREALETFCDSVQVCGDMPAEVKSKVCAYCPRTHTPSPAGEKGEG